MIVINKVLRIPRYFLGVNIKIGLKKREGTRVIGVTNKVGHEYVIFLDYDINDRLMIDDEIRALQKKHSLSTAYLFKTLKGYHVIIPDCLTYQEIKKVLSDATIEDAYYRVPQKNHKKVWVLRLTKKKNNLITYDGMISHNSTRKTSSPHITLLISRGASIDKKQLLNSSYHDKRLLYTTYEA